MQELPWQLVCAQGRKVDGQKDDPTYHPIPAPVHCSCLPSLPHIHHYIMSSSRCLSPRIHHFLISPPPFMVPLFFSSSLSPRHHCPSPSAQLTRLLVLLMTNELTGTERSMNQLCCCLPTSSHCIVFIILSLPASLFPTNWPLVPLPTSKQAGEKWESLTRYKKQGGRQGGYSRKSQCAPVSLFGHLPNLLDCQSRRGKCHSAGSILCCMCGQRNMHKEHLIGNPGKQDSWLFPENCLYICCMLCIQPFILTAQYMKVFLILD